MARCELKIRLDPLGQIQELADAVAALPEHQMRAFEAEWNELESHGAELSEVTPGGGVIYGHLSQDMIQHAAKFGIII